MWLGRRRNHAADTTQLSIASDPPRIDSELTTAPLSSGSTTNLEFTCRAIEEDIERATDELSAQNVQAVDQCGRMIEGATAIAAEARSLLSAAGHLNTSVTSIAGSTEELSASGREIAVQAARSTTLAQAAVLQASGSSATVHKLNQSARSIGDVLRSITDIANRTNLLALNATIEAARAGEAGRGFAIVAAEVKSLAAQTKGFTDDIARRVADIRENAGSAESAIEAMSASIHQINEANASVAAAVQQQDATVSEIARCLQTAAAETGDLTRSVETVSNNAGTVVSLGESTSVAISQTTAVIEDLSGRLVLALRTSAIGNRRGEARVPVEMPATLEADGITVSGVVLDLSGSGALLQTGGLAGIGSKGAGKLSINGIGSIEVERVGGSKTKLHLMFMKLAPETQARLFEVLDGIAADDKRFIDAAIEGARRVSEALRDALRAGSISQHDLFEPVYQPIAGTQPLQYLTAYTELADTLFPPIQEPLLAFDTRVVFAAVVDRNAYLPTHNRKYSHAQRPDDPAWNAAHCRNRRIFNDRAGLAAARCADEHVLQTYERDMGAGQRVLLKEADAPIVIEGRRWGGFRLCYRVGRS